MKKTDLLLPLVAVLFGCGPGNQHFDAEGVFEADEVIVSSEVTGRILSLRLDEGSTLARDSVVALIDSIPMQLQKAQVRATIGSLDQKILDVGPQIQLVREQIAAQQIQLNDLVRERDRTQRLVDADAAPTKQLDDYNTQIDLLRKQIDASRQQIKVQQTAVGTQNSSVISERSPLLRTVAQIDDQLRRATVLNPVSGTVLTRYAMAGEMTAPGKALYKIADLSVITLRVYVSGTQLSGLAIGDPVQVYVDDGPRNYRSYKGVITSVADKAEFTPKTIQTKEERANLVYAVKIKVKNDGLLKIGMYGEIKLANRKQ